MKQLLFAGAMLAATAVCAQRPAPAMTDTTHRPVMAVPGKAKPKPYKEVITVHARTQKGLFTVHQVDDKYYFEIPDSLLGREILTVVRLSRTAGGAGYGGEIANQKSLSFEKGPDNNIFIRVITLISSADSTNAISKAVSNSYLSPIGASLPVAAFGKDSASYVVDVTEFFKTDNTLTGLSAQAKGQYRVGGQAADRSYIQSIRSFPLNTEIRTVKTYTPGGGGGGFQPGMGFGKPTVGDLAGAITLELNTSMLLLPKIPMQRRLYDPRVGYFADDFMLYGDDQQRVDKQEFAVRWRLEPKPEDRERYRRGELVEPAKPIVYYIDPATPKKWRPYLIAGINDWNKAFEKAGFRNAISAHEWPENDTTMSLEDARYSVLRYFASETENAYGPNVHDPRSGEIIESHIGWYHNVMQLLHDWYMIQCGAVDPRARTMKFDDSLMGNLIRFVSSHEVGHTLGLRHNMGASSQTPVELLRNKAWVEAHGHTSSIMDYARFNFVAQPEDNIGEAGLFPRIGDYDKWAIQWGYTYTGLDDPKKDKKENNRWIVDSLKANPRLWFGGEGRSNDPRAQTEDLGDDPSKAGMYGIKNLQRVLQHLPEWTKEEGDTYTNLKEMYGQVIQQFDRYMEHAYKYIGGIEETVKSVEENGPVYAPTPKALQKEAVAFLCGQLFTTPQWLLNTNIENDVLQPSVSVLNPVIKDQEDALRAMFSLRKLGMLEANTTRFGAANAYGIEEMFGDLKKTIWGGLSAHVPSDTYKRNLQKIYVKTLIDILDPPPPPPGVMVIGGGGPGAEITDIYSIVRAQLVTLKKEIDAAIPLTTDHLTRIHLADLSARLTEALDPKR
jgi:hypothetical protein